jgi:hypothetical protein
MRALYLTCAIVFIASACSEEGAPTLPQWSLVEEWRVGGQPEGPHSFDFNMGLALLPGGGFVHFDYKSNQLHYLDSLGKPIRSVGRKGGGPGEFQMVNGLVVAPDGKVIVSDIANGFSIVSDSGEFIDVIKPTVGRIGMGKRWDAFVFSDGQIVENVEQSAGKPGGESLRVIWSADLLHADTLPRLSCVTQSAHVPATRFALRDSTGAVMANLPLMHAEPEKATAFDNGGTVWEQLDPTHPEIVRHGLRDCTATISLRWFGKRAAFDSASRANMIAMANAEARRWHAVAPELSALPSERPWYQSIHRDAVGKLWVERVDEKGHFRVQVFSADGVAVGEIRESSLPVFPMITHTHVYGLVPDKDGVRYLVAYLIKKDGTQIAADIARGQTAG